MAFRVGFWRRRTKILDIRFDIAVEEWRSELGFGEGEQKFWVSGLILPWKIEIGFF